MASKRKATNTDGLPGNLSQTLRKQMSRMMAAAQEMQHHCMKLDLYLQRSRHVSTVDEQPGSAHDWGSPHHLRQSPSSMKAAHDEEKSIEFLEEANNNKLSWSTDKQSPSGNVTKLLTSEMGSATNESVIDSFTADKSAKVFVAGHHGLVGSAVVRKLLHIGFTNLVVRTHSELDLTRLSDVESFFAQEKPCYVILCAAKVGGIHANNTFPADFISINFQIETNVIDASYKNCVKKLLFLGSSCIYPKFAPQPMMEDSLLTGPPEQTNEWYAVAKIAGIKMCQAYRLQYGWDAVSVMPTNLYGPNDNFHAEDSHVLPALMRRFHQAKVSGAKEVVVWGTGSSLQEFLHVDDLADAVVFLMEKYSGLGHVNVGSGIEVTIKELAELVKEVVGFKGELIWDSTKPDRTPRKLMDSSKLAGLGWIPKISLRDGLVDTYKWYLENFS